MARPFEPAPHAARTLYAPNPPTLIPRISIPCTSTPSHFDPCTSSRGFRPSSPPTAHALTIISTCVHALSSRDNPDLGFFELGNRNEARISLRKSSKGVFGEDYGQKAGIQLQVGNYFQTGVQKAPSVASETPDGTTSARTAVPERLVRKSRRWRPPMLRETRQPSYP